MKTFPKIGLIADDFRVPWIVAQFSYFPGRSLSFATSDVDRKHSQPQIKS
jgi:hypothetical protein